MEEDLNETIAEARRLVNLLNTESEVDLKSVLSAIVEAIEKMRMVNEISN